MSTVRKAGGRTKAGGAKGGASAVGPLELGGALAKSASQVLAGIGKPQAPADAADAAGGSFQAHPSQGSPDGLDARDHSDQQQQHHQESFRHGPHDGAADQQVANTSSSPSGQQQEPLQQQQQPVPRRSLGGFGGLGDFVRQRLSGGGGDRRTSSPGNFGFGGAPDGAQAAAAADLDGAANAAGYSGAADTFIMRCTAAAGSVVRNRGAAHVAVAAVLLSLLLLASSSHKAAWQARGSFEALRDQVGTLQQLLARQQAATSRTLDVQAALNATRAQQAALQRQVSALQAEVAGAHQAMDEQGQALEQVRAAAGRRRPDSQGNAGDDGGEDPDEAIARLPACHVRRIEAAAGPILPARVTGHSAIVGDDELVMHFYSALSKVFKSADQRVHPLARQVTYPTTEPACLPLAAGAGGGSVELQLQTPSNVTAISLAYPDPAGWDTAGALRGFELSLWEVGAPPASPPSTLLKRGGRRAPTTSEQQQQPVERRVGMPAMRGTACQTVAVPAAAAGKLVTRLTLRALRNFGSGTFTCVPKVLLHGSTAEAPSGA